MKLQKSRRASRRASRQNRKERKSRKYKGGFVRGTSPILNARAFSGTSAWNRPGAQVQPAALSPSARGGPVLPARSIPVPVAIRPSQVLPVGPNNYRPFASTIQSTYRPHAQGR